MEYMDSCWGFPGIWKSQVYLYSWYLELPYCTTYLSAHYSMNISMYKYTVWIDSSMSQKISNTRCSVTSWIFGPKGWKTSQALQRVLWSRLACLVESTEAHELIKLQSLKFSILEPKCNPKVLRSESIDLLRIEGNIPQISESFLLVAKGHSNSYQVSDSGGGFI